MNNIEINNPFDLKIEFLDFEERQYSLKLLLTCFVINFQEKLIEIKCQIWVECEIWDKFVLQIYKIKIGESKNAKLYSMSDELIVELCEDEYGLSFILHYNKLVNTNINIQSSISSTINMEQLDYLYRHFNSIDKWW